MQHAAIEAGAPTWSPALGKLATSLRDKARAAKVDAFRGNLLLKEEVDESLVAQSKVVEATLLKNDAATTRKRQRVELCLARGKKVQFQGRAVHIELGVNITAEMQAVMFDLGAHHVPEADRVCAAFFVVADIAQPGQRTAWAAALAGGTIMNPTFFASMGKTGVCTALMPAIATPRRV